MAEIFENKKEISKDDMLKILNSAPIDHVVVNNCKTFIENLGIEVSEQPQSDSESFGVIGAICGIPIMERESIEQNVALLVCKDMIIKFAGNEMSILRKPDPFKEFKPIRIS